MIEEKGASMHIESLPVIEADENLMHQLFENLISNSIKYSKDNVKPVVSIWSERVKGSIRFFVKDNGIGFDAKYLPQMFTLFKRLHSAEKYEGTGLGLAICQKIVALHNGSITAKSREGEGSTFIVTLPTIN